MKRLERHDRWLGILRDLLENIRRGKLTKRAQRNLDGLVKKDPFSPAFLRMARANLKAIDMYLENLEPRVEAEKQHPWREDPGKWEDFRNSSPAMQALSRTVKRDMWRRRFAAASLINSKRKKENMTPENYAKQLAAFENAYWRELVEMEDLLEQFREQKARLQREIKEAEEQKTKLQREVKEVGQPNKSEEKSGTVLTNQYSGLPTPGQQPPENPFDRLGSVVKVLKALDDVKTTKQGYSRELSKHEEFKQSLESEETQNQAAPVAKETTQDRRAVKAESRAKTKIPIFGELSSELDEMPVDEGVSPEMLQPGRQPLQSEDLRAQFASEGTRVIDDELTINFDGGVAELSSQLYNLHQRLKTSYPRIDTLPYDVWKSENKTVLRMWLKILARKWETRFDSLDYDVDDTISLVLDEMIKAHELTDEAAERMAQRFAVVFSEKNKMINDAEGSLDLDEFEAEMGWLKPDPDEHREKPSQKKQARSGKGDPSGLPFSWPSKVETAPRKLNPVGSRSFSSAATRHYSTRTYQASSHQSAASEDSQPTQEGETKTAAATRPTNVLPHLTFSGSAHMVSVSAKPNTVRTAVAVGLVHFSNPTPLSLIRNNSLKKGDVLSVARIAGIMAAKQCPTLIPLCHPIALSHVGVILRLFDDQSSSGTEKSQYGGVEIQATVQCTGPTGVEMEALTAVMGAALTVVDMCKAVDKGMSVEGVKVVKKEGGRSGTWLEEGWKEITED
jgi:molybdenum cofactor biosynthesis protein MoaC